MNQIIKDGKVFNPMPSNAKKPLPPPAPPKKKSQFNKDCEALMRNLASDEGFEKRSFGWEMDAETFLEIRKDKVKMSNRNKKTDRERFLAWKSINEANIRTNKKFSDLKKKLDRSEKEIDRLNQENEKLYGRIISSDQDCKVLISILWKTNALLYFQDELTAECFNVFDNQEAAKDLTKKIFNER